MAWAGLSPAAACAPPPPWWPRPPAWRTRRLAGPPQPRQQSLAKGPWRLAGSFCLSLPRSPCGAFCPVVQALLLHPVQPGLCPSPALSLGFPVLLVTSLLSLASVTNCGVVVALLGVQLNKLYRLFDGGDCRSLWRLPVAAGPRAGPPIDGSHPGLGEGGQVCQDRGQELTGPEAHTRYAV